MRAFVRWVAIGAFLASCEGPPGPAGPQGPGGNDGIDGAPGEPGTPATPAPWLTGAGVEIQVNALTVTTSSAVVAFTLTDDNGKPLDRSGALTQGVVTTGFALAQLPLDVAGVPQQYTAYTTRTATAGTASAVQATTETTGSYAVIDVTRGQYTYTFAAPTNGFDPALTQTVLATAARTVDDVRTVDSTTFSLGAAGANAIERGFVADQACRACHGANFAEHGGRYTSVAQCEVCHTAQSSDPDTGNTLDFRVMIHKIHRGADLPSVRGGVPYQVGSTTDDFSTVHFPQAIERCDACHGGAPRGSTAASNPTREACLACHDTTSFVQPVPAGKVLHAGGPQPDSAPCNVCHPASGGAAGVLDKHKDATFDLAVTPTVDIGAITAAPGTAPAFTFTVKVDGVARDILANPLASLRAVMVGPNADFTQYWTIGTSTNPWAQVTMQGAGASGALTALDAANGVFRYAFPATVVIPPAATGSFTLGLEGALRTAPSANESAYPFVSPTKAFAVTGALVARRQIIDPEKCNSCHFDLRFHGGNRRGAQYCITCHNPENANNERVARLEGSTVLAESVDFRMMIHKIHMGNQLSQPYVLGAFPAPSPTDADGTPTDFGHVRYPRSRAECAACHRDGTWQLPAGGAAPSILQELTCSEDPSTDTDTYCNAPFWTVTATRRVPPETAACTGCHDATYVAAHAMVNTTITGIESCATCHGAGATYDVTAVHGQ